MKKTKKSTMYEGLPVVDAPKGEDLEFTITKANVRNSKPNMPSACAAALAISNERHTEVRVHISRTYVKDKKRKVWVRYLTPESVSREIVSFDRGHSFEPGCYAVKSPGEHARLGTYHKGNGHETGNGRKRSRAKHVTTNVRKSAKNKS